MTLTFIGQQITIYGGFFILVAGILGELFTIIVFLSLKTFRQNTSAFYLSIMSFVNIGQLVFGLFSRIMIYGFTIDWNSMSVAFCKVRLTIFLLCSLISYVCLCLAIIDQYLVTCNRIRWQQWSNIKTAYYLIIIFAFICCLFLVPYPIFLQHVTSPTTGMVTCTVTDQNMSIYRNYFITLFLTGYIPDFITVVFGILAYRNIQQIAYRIVPIVRRELDIQLTTMVFIQVLLNFLTNVPCVTMFAILYATTNINNAAILEILQFISTITILIFYTYFGSSFYIYMCVSERFRRQFVYVMTKIYFRRWRQQLAANNQVVPT
ncbi:unnamed protein product [Adineta steineri]|uniref:G-protein coupled receptors family 1 profile domain-containing protein n=1 Tax=Adineta steineri TaxID=433720 RepID=A0A818W9Q5_9BILA|nr:unnamed protein product [Adineta steineri]CAF3721531.1 unnamed protein product [Adineta steineri]